MSQFKGIPHLGTHDGEATAMIYNMQDELFFQSRIQPLARLFLKHGVHLDWAVKFLHRDFAVQENSTMVHVQDHGNEFCTEAELKTLEVRRPRIWHVVGDAVRVWEHEYAEVDAPILHARPPTAFLNEFISIVGGIPNSHLIGICPRIENLRYTTVMDSEHGFRSAPQYRSALSNPRKYTWTETEWHFDNPDADTSDPLATPQSGTALSATAVLTMEHLARLHLTPLPVRSLLPFPVPIVTAQEETLMVKILFDPLTHPTSPTSAFQSSSHATG